jgi:16S rRNA C967 or C1407 C5-methylase (RsmB/RsmF family)
LNAAIKVTKKGGTIVYATCTVAPEENEAVINEFLDRVEVVDTRIKGIPGFTKILGMKFDQSLSKTQRFYPHIHDTQSFFVAKMVKK